MPADEIEEVIGSAIVNHLKDKTWLLGKLKTISAQAAALMTLLCSSVLMHQITSDRPEKDIFRLAMTLVARIDVQSSRVQIHLNLAAMLESAEKHPTLAVAMDVPITFSQNGRSKQIVINPNNKIPQADLDMVALIADARRWMAKLIDGEVASVKELTEKEGLRNGAVSRVLPLAFLAPDITTAILEGNHPPRLTVKMLRDLPELPLSWVEQRKTFGFEKV